MKPDIESGYSVKTRKTPLTEYSADAQLVDAHGRYLEDREPVTLRDKRGNELERSPTVSAENVLKGFAAGLIAGLVGTAVKSLAEKPFPPRPPEQDSPPVILTERILETSLSESEKEAAEKSVHWTFGTVTAGMYGAVAEIAPQASAGLGLPFGTALYMSTHGSTLPALGLERDQPAERRVNEYITHLMYGASVELPRKYVRKLLD